MNRITADIDTKNRIVLLLAITRAIIRIKKIVLIEIKPSYRKGYHLTVHSNHKYTKKQIFKLRALLLDDKKRIAMDRLRKVGTQTFFDKKEKFNVTHVLNSSDKPLK